MPNGDSAASTVADAQSAFPEDPPSPSLKCQPPKKKEPKPAPTCTAEQLNKNLDACSGGSDPRADAKKAIGKDPTVKVEATKSGFDAETDTSTGTIKIKPTSDCCDATASLLFELVNASNTPKFNKVDGDAAKGDLGREEYTKASEKIEYDASVRLRDTFKKCKKSWGCADGATSGFENVPDDFDKYYDNWLATSHKDYYRGAWDRNYKAAYQKKHPPKK